MKRVLLFLSGSVCVLGFVCFTLYARHANFHQLDFDTTVKLQNHTPRRLDPLLSYLSLVGNIWVISVAILALLWVNRKHWGIMIPVCYGAGLGIEVIGKSIFTHPAPPFEFYRYNFGPVFPGSYVHDLHSYPSGHSLRTAFIAIVFCLTVWNAAKLPLWIKSFLIAGALGFGALMFYSRISLGEHWTSDVIAGTLLGGGLALMCGTFIYHRSSDPSDGTRSASSSE